MVWSEGEERGKFGSYCKCNGVRNNKKEDSRLERGEREPHSCGEVRGSLTAVGR